MKKRLFYFILICSIVYVAFSCAESFVDSSNIHSDLFEVSENLVGVDGSSCYMVRLKTSLTNIPDNLIIPKEVNGKKIEGLFSDSFRSYHIKNVYVHSFIKFIPYSLLFDSHVEKITLPKRFKDNLMLNPNTEVIYY